MSNVFFPSARKAHMFCDSCNRTMPHKRNVFMRQLWRCTRCGYERHYKKSKSDWLERKQEAKEKQKKFDKKDAEQFKNFLQSL